MAYRPIIMKRCHQGFTLIELLMVISVIAILSAMILSGIFVAARIAKRNAIKIKCKNLAKGTLSMLADRNLTGRPMMENLIGEFPTVRDPFMQASMIKIDWELNPNHPKWRSIMNPGNHESPYFPRINNKLKIGKDRYNIGAYNFGSYCDFDMKEIEKGGDGFPHAMDPWKVKEYLYFCYYVQSDAGRYLVDGILSRGQDGLFTDPGSSPVKEQVWSPTNKEDEMNKDNAWMEIDRYPRSQ